MEVNINDREHVMFTHKTEDTIEYVLYDGNESWIESSSISGILQRGKEHNKRINFDEETILSNLEKSKPVSIEWVEDEPSEQNQKNLKIKYSVEGHPLYFTWRLRKLTTNEFEKYMLCILINLCEALTKQNEELREIVQKKDIEINQYKFEGAVLKRVTVGTKPFDASEFDKKHSTTNNLSKSIRNVTDRLNEQLGKRGSRAKRNGSSSPVVGDKRSNESDDVKLTPRRKRRKMLEEQQRIVAEKLKVRGKALQYDSSQSEAITVSSPEIVDVDFPKQLKMSPDNKSSNSNRVDKETLLPPSKVPRTRRETSRDKPDCKPALRSRRKANYVEYESGGSSTEENGDVTPTKKGKSTEKPAIKKKSPSPSISKSIKKKSPSPSISKSDGSSDIQTIINDWRDLEQRRVADLDNVRKTRTSKRTSH